VSDKKKGRITEQENVTPQGIETGASASDNAPTVERWRLIIAGVFFLALIVQLVLATLIRVWEYINPEDYAPMVVKLLTIYSTPFGVILGGMLITRQTNPPTQVLMRSGWFCCSRSCGTLYCLRGICSLLSNQSGTQLSSSHPSRTTCSRRAIF
jgi:hypothetical protein